MNGKFCGLAEMYGYREEYHKISVGYRLSEHFWGKGIATEALSLMVSYLYSETDIEIITASTMVDNKASAHVLEKNGFTSTNRIHKEDWGHAESTNAYRWFL